MKILIAVHHFPPRFQAGAELRACRTARWMRRRGHDARVIAVERIDHGPDDGAAWQDDEYEGVPVRRLFYDLRKAPAARPADRLRWEYDNPWIERHLAGCLSEWQPDLFHLISGYIMGAGALKAARHARVPAVVTLVDFWFFCRRLTLLQPAGRLSSPTSYDPRACARCFFEEKRRFRVIAQKMPAVASAWWSLAFSTGLGRLLGLDDITRQFEARYHDLMTALRAAAVIVCPSRFLIETFTAHGIDRHRLVLNTHGLDTSLWLPAAPRAPDGVFRVGYIGQIEHHKGAHLAAQALPRLRADRPLELLIYGNEQAAPAYTEFLRRQIAGDARIRIMGRYSNEQVAQILAQFDALVIPSLWPEIGPWTLFEAFEARLPVVATNLPNMSYVVEHDRNGLLFRAGDVDDLARQLQRLIDEPALAQRLVANIPPVRTIDEEMAVLQEVYRRAACQTPA